MTSTTKQKKQLKVAEASASYLVEPQEVRHSSESRNPALSSVGWRTAKLGEILPLKYGKARTEQFGHLRPQTAIFGSNGAFGTFDRALTKTAAIIVGRKGAAGAVHYSHEPCWPIDTALYTEGSEGVFLPFFRYLLESLQLVRLDRSTAIPSLSRDDYDSKIIRYPEALCEQRNIVSEIEKQFTRLEAGIAALRRVQANLKRYRAAVLKAACEGRLVPTEAELAKKECRAYESADKLLDHILTERREKWAGRGKYSEPAPAVSGVLPSAPEGWTEASLEQLTSANRVICYGILMPKEHVPDGVPYVKVRDLKGDKIDFASLPRTAPEIAAKYARASLKPGDVLLAIRGTYGRVAEVPSELDGGNITQDTARLAFTTLVDRHYLAWFLRSEDAQNYFKRVARGVAVKGVNIGDVRPCPILLPPLLEQSRIVAEVERLLSVVDEQEAVVSANLQRAIRLRQSVLQRAFTGQLVDYESTNPVKLNAQTALAKRPNRHFARALLSAEIVHQLHTEPTFGRVKHQKIFHLCEHIAQITEIEGEYHREAAGPLDNKLIYANETELKKQDWYATVKRSSYGHAYQPLKKAGTHLRYMERYWPHKIGAIRKLIEQMRGWDTDRCEIFSTTYAAWNDLLLWGHEATEETIVHEILNRWHDSKRRISEKRWRSAIAWIKKEGFAPTGFGKPTCSLENA